MTAQHDTIEIRDPKHWHNSLAVTPSSNEDLRAGLRFHAIEGGGETEVDVSLPDQARLFLHLAKNLGINLKAAQQAVSGLAEYGAEPWDSQAAALREVLRLGNSLEEE